MNWTAGIRRVLGLISLVKVGSLKVSLSHPTWLDLAHRWLDEAVFAAYGWKSDLSDEEILEKLLSLNLERAKQNI